MFSPKKNTPQRRTFRSLFIEPFKQVKFGLSFLGLSSLFLLIMAYMIVTAFMAQYEQLMELYEVTDEGAKYALITNDVFMSNIIYLSLAYFFYILVLFYAVFKITHRFYGPTVAIQRFTKQIEKGNYAFRLHLRKGDELQNVAAYLNTMAETLQNKHGIPKEEDPKKA